MLMDNTADRATDESGIELGSTIDNKDGSLNDDGHQYEGAQKDEESQPFIQAGNGMVVSFDVITITNMLRIKDLTLQTMHCNRHFFVQVEMSTQAYLSLTLE